MSLPSSPADRPYTLRLLGTVRLMGKQGEVRLQKRVAAILAYLALEGAAPKYRLAGWLWPDSPAPTARNNLRQALKRLRDAAGAELVVGDENISLSEGLEVDTAQLFSLAFAGEDGRAALFEGRLLEGLEFDEFPDFEEWLQGAREELDTLRREAAQAEADRLEAQGRPAEALPLARRALDLDPLSEEAHRRVMRLFYLAGDRGAALAAYERCRQLLAQEFGTEPLPQTQALAREIEQGGRVTGPTAAAKPAIPLALSRPPVLVGREREWAVMESAWQAGQIIYLIGEAGSGKTRLAQDFVASKGRGLYLPARPDHRTIPFAVAASLARSRLEAAPQAALPEWVRRELSRILPELSAEAPPPLQSEADRLRFFQAYLEMVRLTGAGFVASISDDGQYYDDATIELGAFMMSQRFPFGTQGNIPRYVVIFRRGEVPAASREAIGRQLQAGIAVRLDLEPLPPGEVGRLLGELRVPGLSDLSGELSAPLTRFTGGNPMFVLETVRYLYESGQLERGWPGRLPPPGKVGQVIAGRLEKLSPQGLNLARAAAVLGSDLSLERAAALLEESPLGLAPAWRELEEAQIFRGSAFSHDLLYETTLATTPQAIQAYLHRRAAAVLEQAARESASPVAAVRVAQHWLAAGETARAAPWLWEAAQTAQAAYRLREAADLYRQAAWGFEARGERQAAFQALERSLGLQFRFDLGSRPEADLERLLSLAETPAEYALARRTQAELLQNRGDGAEAEAAARQGLALEERLEPRLRAELTDALGMALWQQGRVEEAAQVFDAARRLAEPLGGEEPGATILDHLAMALDNLDRTHESIPYFRQAVVLSQDRVQRSARLVNLGAALVNVGLAREGIGPLLEARQTLRQVAGAADTERHALAQIGNAQAILARYTEALADLEAARALTEAHGLPRGFVHLMLARTLIPLGQYAEAERHLQTTLEQPNLRPILHTRALITLGRLRALSGEPAAALFERAGGLLDASHPWLVALLGLDRSVVEAPEPALAFAEAARQTAYRYQLHGLAVGASTRAAQALLRLGRPAEALARVQEAVTLLEAYDPTDFYPGEVLWTHYRALRDNHHPAASAALQEALRWVRAASRQVPEAYRESFLYLNPVNRSLLEAAGLPIGGSG